MSVGIRAENIHWKIQGRTILFDLHAEFHAGSTTAVVGPNGSGKSTFLRILAGTLSPSQGVVRYRGIQPDHDISLLATQTSLNLEAPLLVRDLIQMAFYRRGGVWNRPPPSDLDTFEKLIEELHLKPFILQPISTLSSGQRQKALLARLILENPQVILLDEPFNALDTGATQFLLNQIHRWQREGKIVVVVSHQMELVLQNFSQTLFLSPRYVAQGPTRFVLGNAPKELLQSYQGIERNH